MLPLILSTKIVYMEKEETSQIEKYLLHSHQFEDSLDLSCIIETVADWSDQKFSIYSPEDDTYFPLHALCHRGFSISKHLLPLDVVMIRYSRQEKQNIQKQEESQDCKKQRSKQRNIKEVIEMVHRWRDIHQFTKQNKKVNLQQAAKIIGISKKSLDDYFFQLRMGQKYGFDFDRNMNNRVGVLRSFVKQQQQNQKKKGFTENHTRYSKKLKISKSSLEKTQIKQNSTTCFVKAQQDDEINPCLVEFAEPNTVQGEGQIFWGSPYTKMCQKQFLDCENSFFKDFQNINQQVNDPFIPFTAFRKNHSIFVGESNSSTNLF